MDLVTIKQLAFENMGNKSSHSWKEKGNNYIKLHQDADHLDHFGTFDVWTEFLHAIHHNRTIIDVIEWFQTTRRKQDEHYRNELNFEISKKIYDEKSEFVKSFGDRLSVEGYGKIWNEKELMKVIE